MAKDKSGKSNIKAGVLTLTDEELEQAEARKDWVGGGSGVPDIGEHDGTITLFEPGEISTSEKTKGGQKYRIEVTLDEDGSRLNEFPIAHPSVAGRMLKVLEVTGLYNQERNAATGKNELVLPGKSECASAVGTRVRVKVTGHQDQYRDRELPKEERRQQAVWGFVSALGPAGKASKGSKAATSVPAASGGKTSKDKGEKVKIAR